MPGWFYQAPGFAGCSACNRSWRKSMPPWPSTAASCRPAAPRAAVRMRKDGPWEKDGPWVGAVPLLEEVMDDSLGICLKYTLQIVRWDFESSLLDVICMVWPLQQFSVFRWNVGKAMEKWHWYIGWWSFHVTTTCIQLAWSQPLRIHGVWDSDQTGSDHPFPQIAGLGHSKLIAQWESFQWLKLGSGETQLQSR